MIERQIFDMNQIDWCNPVWYRFSDLVDCVGALITVVSVVAFASLSVQLTNIVDQFLYQECLDSFQAFKIVLQIDNKKCILQSTQKGG